MSVQVVAQEPVKLSMKIHMFLSRIWNLWDLLAIALFCVGACLRFFPSRLKDAHLVYVVDVVLWNTRILEILSVNQYLGPYVKIIAKLVVYSFLLGVGGKETGKGGGGGVMRNASGGHEVNMMLLETLPCLL